MVVDVLVIVGDPCLARRHVATICPPVSAIEADDCEQRILNLVKRQHARVSYRRLQRRDVERKDPRESSQQELLGTPLLATLLARPVGDRVRLRGTDNRIGDRLLRLGGNNRELNHGLALAVSVGAVVTLQPVLHTKPEELVQHGDLIAEELQQLMRVPNSLARRHQRCVHDCVEVLETHCARR